ncbi:MAG: DUF3035 domain-containing protein, partial [Rickettsiales bacterium]
MHKLQRIALLGLMASSLVACSGQEVKKSLGLKRNNPDAFQVVSRPPLSVPPVYHLNPPASEPVETSSVDAVAEALVLEGREIERTRRPSMQGNGVETAVISVGESNLGTAADEVLLRHAGANVAQP